MRSDLVYVDVGINPLQVVQQAAVEERPDFEDPVRFVIRTWPWPDQPEGLPQVHELTLTNTLTKIHSHTLTTPHSQTLSTPHSGSAQSENGECASPRRPGGRRRPFDGHVALPPGGDEDQFRSFFQTIETI